MKVPVVLLLLLCTCAPPAVLAATGHAGALGLGGSLGSGETLYVQVVEPETLGPVAGLVTREASGLFGTGIGATSSPHTNGWVIVAPTGQVPAAGAELTVTDELGFTDPNGATWLAREVAHDGGVAWTVPLGPVTYDATLDADYNFALIVDWDLVPEHAELVVLVVPHVVLA